MKPRQAAQGEKRIPNRAGRAYQVWLFVVSLLVPVGCSAGSPPAASNGSAEDQKPPVSIEQKRPAPERAAAADAVAAAASPKEEPSAAVPAPPAVELAAEPAVKPQHEFVGAKKCAMCHSSPAIGRQYQAWLASKHAQAFPTLGTPRAKELAAGWHIDNPQTSGRCLKCHSTAYGFTEARISEQITVEEGVSCETCHGPGKDYMKLAVMKNREAAVAAGLRIPNEETCRKCHGAGGPVAMPFNFAEASEQIKHPIPK